MMQNVLNKLFEVLVQQIRVYENILKLAKEKTDIVVAGKITELENLVKLEQALVVQIGRLEQQREEVVDEIAAVLNINKQDVTMSSLTEYLDVLQKEKLKNYQQKLTNILDELKNTNELNAKLIKQALEYVEFSINAMTSTSVSGSGYEGKGTVKESKGNKHLFDVKL
ncbi:MAG: hypothetical protein PWP27_1912 [Clostridiales bacterium]|jgi:flagellar biosynthesis/type III secretory pathway chaperone|nr:hypothetical protein [Clostridiales bacterium]MDK2934102.1 hypothetical protein [Clostridiales bacterium]